MTVNDQLLAQQAQQLRLTGLSEPLSLSSLKKVQYSKLRTEVGSSQH